jgi:uncharacterized membrane protein
MPKPALVAAGLFPVYLALSVTRHRRLHSTGYDLGISEQAVRAYAEFRAPVAELKGPGYHLLGDHFHPLLAAIAPVYRIWPSPITLLTVQALLFALSAVPVTRLATRVLGSGPGLAIGAAYGLAWGVQSAVEFDFHEICLAVVPLAFCLEQLVMRLPLPHLPESRSPARVGRDLRPSGMDDPGPV